jgi:membrane protease YdiL (CAAX protease family)
MGDSMTLAAAVAPLVAYAVVFQTILYMFLPARLRSRIAPLVTGLVGAGMALAAGWVFGFEEVGLIGGEATTALAWGVATVLLIGVVGTLMMGRDGLRARLADPRLASLSRGHAFIQIGMRIPVFTVLIEEAFFRGVLHAALMALYPVDVAIWLGAGLFGLWHIGPGLDQARAGENAWAGAALHTGVTVVATTAAGLFLVWLRIETGSIWAPVAVHAAMNMTLAAFARFASHRSPAVGPLAGP